jgi:predicted lipid-binding transport protein (Tim44 family)
MNKLLWTVALAVGVAFALAPAVSEAKRLGGGKPAGMQRSVPDKSVQSTPANATPNTPAAPAAAPNAAPGTAAAAAAAAAPKRSWMGPIAGLAAGLGLAALFSHLGMGEGFANFVMLALLAVVAFVVIRLLMQRFMGGGVQRPPLAMAGAAAGGAPPVVAAPPRFVDERPGMQREALAPVTIGSALQPPLAVPDLAAAPVAPVLPSGFDAEGFERLAKMLFIRMQAANDSADLNDLRNFTTPELFASLRVDLQDRGDVKQHTDVVKVDAKLIDFAQESERQVVSVRFNGLIREDASAEAAPFDEVWHLVKPVDDSRNWAIAGIQQAQ